MTKEAVVNITTVRKASPEDVERFREAIKNFANEDPSLIHPADLRRVQEDAYFCKRYIFAGKGDFDRALEVARRSLEWRKSFGVNDFDENSPQGALSMRHLSVSSLFPYGRTKSGAHLLMFRSRFHGKPRTPEERLEHQKLVAHIVELMVIERGVKRLAFMFDCQATGISNTDIDGIKFIITIFRDYYPYVLERIYVVELPWILNATWKLIKGLLPSDAQKIIVFKTKAELAEDIDASNLPKWLDGTNEYSYTYIPGKTLGELCPPVKQQQQQENTIA